MVLKKCVSKRVFRSDDNHLAEQLSINEKYWTLLHEEKTFKCNLNILF